MARQRNTKRTDPTASLIAQLRDQICIPEIPAGWIAASQLAESCNVDINTLHRRMQKLGHGKKRFKVPGTRAPSVWCYKLSK